MPVRPKRESLFETKFDCKGPDECWPWVAKSKQGQMGYGCFWDGSRNIAAHRFSYQLYVGEIPPGACVLHRCDNPLCVNPNHLFLGSLGDNNHDAIAKGRHSFRTRFQPKLPWEVILKIRKLYEPRRIGYLKLAKRFGISAGHVRQIIKATRRQTQ